MDASFKKIILTVIASIAGFLLLVAIGLYVYFINQFAVYQDDQYKFSIKYPKTWTVLVRPKHNVAVLFMRPKDTELDAVQENFSVVVQPVSDQDHDLTVFNNNVRNQMLAVFGSHIKIVQDKPIHWGWRQGHQFAFEATEPDHLKMVNAWLVREDQAYILTFFGIIHKDFQDPFIIGEMIKSLQLE